MENPTYVFSAAASRGFKMVLRPTAAATRGCTMVLITEAVKTSLWEVHAL